MDGMLSLKYQRGSPVFEILPLLFAVGIQQKAISAAGSQTWHRHLEPGKEEKEREREKEFSQGKGQPA